MVHKKACYKQQAIKIQSEVMDLHQVTCSQAITIQSGVMDYVTCSRLSPASTLCMYNSATPCMLHAKHASKTIASALVPGLLKSETRMTASVLKQGPNK